MNAPKDYKLALFCSDPKNQDIIKEGFLEVAKLMRNLSADHHGNKVISHEILASAWMQYAVLTKTTNAAAAIAATMLQEMSKHDPSIEVRVVQTPKTPTSEGFTQ